MKIHTLLTCITIITALGCSRSSSSQKQADPPETKTATPQGPGHGAHHHHGMGYGMHHDQAMHAGHGSINCPYAKKTSHDNHRPFATTAEYIAHLESPERLKWQRPDQVVKALGLKGDEVITDMGAGSGFFAFRFASAVPRGHVHALDIDQAMVDYMVKKKTARKVANLTAIKTSPDRPTLGKGTTIVFMNNVLHHVPGAGAWLSHIASQLPAGGRLVVLEFKMGSLPMGPPDSRKITPERVMDLTKKAGLTLTGEKKGILPYQHFYVFTKSP